MALPSMMYFASVGTCPSLPQASGYMLVNSAIDVVLGIVDIYQNSGAKLYTTTTTNITTSYLSICLPLNVLLTLLIVTRLIMHIKIARRVTGASGGSSGLHTVATAVVTMLIESYALYAITLLLFIAPWAVDSSVLLLFSEVIASMQVCSLFAST